MLEHQCPARRSTLASSRDAIDRHSLVATRYSRKLTILRDIAGASLQTLSIAALHSCSFAMSRARHLAVFSVGRPKHPPQPFPAGFVDPPRILQSLLGAVRHLIRPRALPSYQSFWIERVPSPLPEDTWPDSCFGRAHGRYWSRLDFDRSCICARPRHWVWRSGAQLRASPPPCPRNPRDAHEIEPGTFTEIDTAGAHTHRHGA